MWATDRRFYAACVLSVIFAATGGVVAVSSSSGGAAEPPASAQPPASADPRASAEPRASGALSHGMMGTLVGVDALSSTQAWAVGSVYNAHLGIDRTLIQRWDGSSWARVPSPSPGAKTNNSSVSGVSGWSTTDAWAVGASAPKNGGPSRTLALHWDGVAWTRVPCPSPPFSSVLSRVASVSPTEAWAVGTTTGRSRARFRPLIEHWHNGAWTVVRSSMTEGNNGFLSGISAILPTDVWAVGATKDPATGVTKT